MADQYASPSSSARTPSVVAHPLFETLFEHSPDAIVVTDDEGTIHQVNVRTEQLFGYTRAELIGKAVEMLVPEKFRQGHPAHRRKYLSHPQPRPMGAGLRLLGRRKDGSEVPIDIMLNTVDTEHGRRVLSVIRDMTEQRHAQDQIYRREQLLRSLMSGIRDYAVFLLDADGNILTWNEGAQQIKGYTAEEIIGKHFSIFYPQAEIDHGKPAKELEIAKTAGRYEEEGWRLRKDGSRFWANVIITPIFDSHGAVVAFSKITRDFTGRKKAEDALLGQLSHALLATPDINRVLPVISGTLQQLVSHDVATMALHDPDAGALRVLMISGNAPSTKHQESLVPIDGSPAGEAFRREQPLLLSRPDFRNYEHGMQHFSHADLNSACWVPLKRDGRNIGTLMVGRTGDGHLSDGDLEVLLLAAKQISTAVDTTFEYGRLRGLTERLRLEREYLQEELETEYRFEEIIGESAALRKVLKQVETVATTDATVLILGETGTGKELIARAIHRLSPRKDHTLIKLNCAAIPSGLLESELFGHEKGAFTGAISQKVGRLELANHGTLFLDEVGDIPLELQPKLLRALQEKEFERLGSTRTIPVDIRLIAATNRNLEKMVADRQFRSDLYYRLRVFPIGVPPLRSRRGDIPLLVRHFVDKHARRLGRSIEQIPDEVMHALEQWSWPGNVRELENFLERAVILTRGPVLRAPLSELVVLEPGLETSEDPSLSSAEREHILKALRDTRGVIGGVEGAAARLGVKRTTLNSKMKKLGITRSDYMSSSDD